MYFEDRTVGGKNRILYTGVEFLFCWPDQRPHRAPRDNDSQCLLQHMVIHNWAKHFFNLITPYPVYRICIFDHLIILKDLEWSLTPYMNTVSRKLKIFNAYKSNPYRRMFATTKSVVKVVLFISIVIKHIIHLYFLFLIWRNHYFNNHPDYKKTLRLDIAFKRNIPFHNFIKNYKYIYYR